MHLALRVFFYINIFFYKLRKYLRHSNWTKVFADDDKDRQGLKLEKIGPTFLHILMLCLQKSKKLLLWLVLVDELCLIFFITVQECFVSVMTSAQN